VPGKILVVDDDAASREGLARLLRREGYEVSVAGDGRAVPELVERLAPDLVLLDVVMEPVDGFEVCRRLKADPETRLTPVVLVTGQAPPEERLRGVEAGADDFLRKPVDVAELLARVRSLVLLKSRTDELERVETILFSLALSIESRDDHTHGHCERLAEYSARLGTALGLAAEQVTALRRAGIVHDIGKVAVPDAILLKPGPLTPEEEAVLRRHPVVGERICAPLKSFRLVLPIIRHHHEKWDGSGYPDGLRGAAIPLTARVLQIVDVFDALTTARPYKPALPVDEALRTMEEEVGRGWWDREVFSAFRELIAGESVSAAPAGAGSSLGAASPASAASSGSGATSADGSAAGPVAD
jgi:putative two-component system response regulator